MEHMSLQQLAMLVVIALMVFGTRRLSRRGMRLDDLSQLREELQRHMPVYAAETTERKEAEFIRDRLPKRFPIVIVVIAIVVFGAVAWWLNR